MDELKPLQRTDFTAMDGDFGPTLIRHTHPGGKWADNFAVRMIERIDGLMGQITALKGLVLSIEGNRGEVHGGVNFASDTREYGKCPDCGDLAPLKNGYCNFCEPKHKEGLVEERYG